jgi:hypothetical protein
VLNKTGASISLATAHRTRGDESVARQNVSTA